MIDLPKLFDALNDPFFSKWRDGLQVQIEQALSLSQHGDLKDWLETLEHLPRVDPSTPILTQQRVQSNCASTLAPTTNKNIQTLLQKLHPWRKGPYDILGIHIDSEWRSDLKWARLCEHIKPLTGKTVLDIGCGNGYHCWRMAGAGARTVIGIDPTLLSVVQFHAIKHFIGNLPVFVLPLGIEHIAGKISGFDSVFSMGVLYHRRSPIDHLLEIKELLKNGGELVLETLVIEGDLGHILVPEHRYAKMRNVWFLPSCATLKSWLKRCGFKNVRLVDINQTTTAEQRTTAWMRFHSLSDFLDPDNPDLTCEGLPAPKRAIFLADAP